MFQEGFVAAGKWLLHPRGLRTVLVEGVGIGSEIAREPEIAVSSREAENAQ